jgi:hypothetical protein
MNTVRDMDKSSYKKNKKKKEKLGKDFGETTAVAKTKKVHQRITENKVKKVIKLIETGMSERGACREVGVNTSSFRQAVTRLRVSDQYTRATTVLAEHQINLMEELLEDLREGQITSDMARVELDARKWFASKLLPKKYGDKVEHEQNINVNFTNNIPRPKVIEADAISSVPSLPSSSSDPQ